MSIGKLQRFEELKTFPNSLELIFDYKNPQFFEYRNNWKKVFNNSNDIVLELGCGKGEYTLFLAQKYKDKNFIGIDIKGARIWRGAKEALKQDLKNVFFLRTHIEFLNYIFGEDEISEIWIPHPDPQPKKPNKRLSSPYFLSLYQKVIKNNSIINLKTDSTELYTYTKDIIENNNLVCLEISDDIYNSNVKSEVVEVKTFYELMFLNQGQKIKFISFLLPKAQTIVEPLYRFIPKYKY